MRKDRTIRLLNTTFRAIELIPNLLFIALSLYLAAEDADPSLS